MAPLERLVAFADVAAGFVWAKAKNKKTTTTIRRNDFLKSINYECNNVEMWEMWECDKCDPDSYRDVEMILGLGSDCFWN